MHKPFFMKRIKHRGSERMNEQANHACEKRKRKQEIQFSPNLARLVFVSAYIRPANK